MIKIPVSVIFLFVYLQHWYLVVPAIAILVLIGFVVPDLARLWRWVAVGAAAVLALPLLLGGTIIVVDEISSAMKLAALQRTLAHQQTIGGLALPAGSMVHFRDQSHTQVGSVDLPGVAEIRDCR